MYLQTFHKKRQRPSNYSGEGGISLEIPCFSDHRTDIHCFDNEMKTFRCVPKQWARWNSSYFTPRRLALTTLRSCRSRSPRSWCTSSRDFSSSSNRGKHRIMTDLNNDDVRQRCAPKRASQQGAEDDPASFLPRSSNFGNGRTLLNPCIQQPSHTSLAAAAEEALTDPGT